MSLISGMTLLLFHSNILQRLDRSTRAPRSPLTGRGDLNTIIKLNPKPKTKPEGERSPLLVQETVRVVQRERGGDGTGTGRLEEVATTTRRLIVSRSSPDPYAYNAGGEARVKLKYLSPTRTRTRRLAAAYYCGLLVAPGAPARPAEQVERVPGLLTPARGPRRRRLPSRRWRVHPGRLGGPASISPSFSPAGYTRALGPWSRWPRGCRHP